MSETRGTPWSLQLKRPLHVSESSAAECLPAPISLQSYGFQGNGIRQASGTHKKIVFEEEKNGQCKAGIF